jgi:hypothetical protein
MTRGVRGMREGEREWPETETTLLREMWPAHSAKAIGEMFKPIRTPSGVTGMAHRMKLPGKPSPIKPKPKVPTPPRAPRLPPPPPPPLTEEEIEWKNYCRWAPGDPSLWPWRQESA